MNILTGYIGTYASPQSLGIYRFSMDLDNGNLSRPELYYDALDCKYLSLYGTLLAAPRKRDGQAGICLLDTAGAVSAWQEKHFMRQPRPAMSSRMTLIYTLPIITKDASWSIRNPPAA